jgi:hypothetical protein
MPTQSFPSTDQIKQVALIEHNARLYDGDHAAIFGIKDYFIDDTKKVQKLYIAANLPAMITDYFADMMIGEGLTYSIEDDTTQKELDIIVDENAMDEMLLEIAQDQSYAGFGVLRVRQTEEEGQVNVVVESVDPQEYYPKYDARDRRRTNPTEVTLAAWLVDPVGKHKGGIIYKTVYKRVNQLVTVQYEVWSQAADKTEKENLKSDPAYVAIYPEIAKEPMTLEKAKRIPVWEVSNTRTRKNPLGKSDYKDIQGLVQEINDRLTHVSIQLIKNMNSRLAVPAGWLGDEEGSENRPKPHEIDMFEMNQGEPEPKYIVNTNPMIDQAFTFVDKIILMALGIAKVPPELLNVGDAVAGANLKVEAMRIRMFPTMRKIHRKQNAMKPAVEQALTYALELKGKAKDGLTVAVDFDDVLPVDMLQLVTQMVERKTAGLISTRTAIEEMDGLTDEEAQAEMDRIDEEQPTIEPFQSFPTLPAA